MCGPSARWPEGSRVTSWSREPAHPRRVFIAPVPASSRRKEDPEAPVRKTNGKKKTETMMAPQGRQQPFHQDRCPARATRAEGLLFEAAPSRASGKPLATRVIPKPFSRARGLSPGAALARQSVREHRTPNKVSHYATYR